MLLWLLIVVFLVFRWPILERFIGTVHMLLFDAVIFTLLAAINFAQPSSIPWLAYLVGSLCVLLAFTSSIRCLMLDNLQRKENERNKSNIGPTAGV